MFIERCESRVEEKIKRGKHLPIGVWQKKGWPKEVIEQCADWYMHPTLKIKMYFVETTEQNDMQTQGTKLSFNLKASGNVKSKAAPKQKKPTTTGTALAEKITQDEANIQYKTLGGGGGVN